MTNKQQFIEQIEDILTTPGIKLTEEAEQYFESLKNSSEKTPAVITKNGEKILTYMADNIDACSNEFVTTSIAEGLNTSGKSVSGSMRKLITEGFVTKIKENPVTYNITDKGIDFIKNKNN